MTEAKAVIDRHLAAIDDRDLAAYAATLHANVVLVLPDGSRFEGRAAVEGFHREFFAEPGWTQVLTEVSVRMADSAAVAVYEADYRAVGDDGAESRKRFLLTLVFVRDETSWSLFHDQCTPLPD